MTTNKQDERLTGGEEGIKVTVMGVLGDLEEIPKVPLDGKWRVMLSTVLQDQPWVLVCTLQTPFQIRSTSTFELSRLR